MTGEGLRATTQSAGRLSGAHVGKTGFIRDGFSAAGPCRGKLFSIPPLQIVHVPGRLDHV
jgi:hypothetical protein